MDRWLNSHWFVRGIALLLAIMLWMIVNLEPEQGNSSEAVQPTRIIESAKVKAYYDADNFEITNKLQSVKVAVESNNPFLKYNIFDNYEVFIDARGLASGAHRLQVQSRGFPDGSKVTITPDYIDVTLEEKQTVEMDVQVEKIGKEADGYELKQPIVKPFRVLVTVPASQVKKIGVVKAAVNVDGATDTVSSNAQLKVYDKQGNQMTGAEISPLVVEVNIPVTSPSKMVPLKLNLTNELPDGYSLASITMNTQEVTVYGPNEVIKPLDTYSGPIIDLKNITSDRVLQLKMPLALKVVKVDPDTLDVTLKIVPSETKKLENVPLRVTGLAEDLVAKVVTADGQELSTVSFDVIGAPNILKDLTANDIQIVADVSSLPVGVHEIPLVYNNNLPDYLKIASNALNQVTVEITKKQ
ncbi:CdaR family protein [Brevibacillus laterosporus]|uniref:CdaR family protein n=1 Tax=Brevibacillus laterosporus TaxID=1465 RepID=UPI0011292A95|nr:CdaR family protein [Brevibacillus laterosporus]MBG9801104.1 membrane protein [Brevibacillus laterosporus]MED4765371.1 CdaR family protein [Brevibacillus laterosporus]TPH11051.1 hypothetical protein EGH09_19320 [Brevibacillus laterosporus]